MGTVAGAPWVYILGRSRMGRRLLPIAAAITLMAVSLAGCQTASTAKLHIVTSTSLIESIVKQIGGNLVDISNLVPPNQHPGNFDIKPGDIQKLANADLLILHGYPGETWADRLISSANNPKMTVVKTSVNGNWMIPSVQIAATDRVLEILTAADPADNSVFIANADAYRKAIQQKESDVKAKLTRANVSSVAVIASWRQADFLQWAGFNVVATFTDPQSLTPQVVKDLVDKGKAAGVRMVVNNLQDGQDAGKAVAGDLAAKNINLSNFPGGLPNTETWQKAIDKNVTLLLDAAGKQ